MAWVEVRGMLQPHVSDGDQSLRAILGHLSRLDFDLPPCFLLALPSRYAIRTHADVTLPCALAYSATPAYVAHNHQLVPVTANVAPNQIGQPQERRVDCDIVGAGNARRVPGTCACGPSISLFIACVALHHIASIGLCLVPCGAVISL